MALCPTSAALAASAVIGLAGCGGTGGDAPVEVSRGQALFDANCASCHGERALGDGPMASTLPVPPPSLMEHLGHHAEDQLVRLIREGVPPAMPPAPLTEQEVRLVVDYAWTLVPDSLVAGLREMQRMAESGMHMDMDMGGNMPETGGMETSGDGSDAMGAMAPDTGGRAITAPPDTIPR